MLPKQKKDKDQEDEDGDDGDDDGQAANSYKYVSCHCEKRWFERPLKVLSVPHNVPHRGKSKAGLP